MSWFDYYPILSKDYYQSRLIGKCECGAAKTRNPNLHAEWCPKYEKGKFQTDSVRRKGNEDEK